MFYITKNRPFSMPGLRSHQLTNTNIELLQSNNDTCLPTRNVLRMLIFAWWFSTCLFQTDHQFFEYHVLSFLPAWECSSYAQILPDKIRSSTGSLSFYTGAMCSWILLNASSHFSLPAMFKIEIYSITSDLRILNLLTFRLIPFPFSYIRSFHFFKCL